MKICYLTWGETPRFSGIFKSQVIGQFIHTRKKMQESEFYFIAGLPIIHSGLVREKFGYPKELKKIRECFNQNNIHFNIIPIFSPQHFFNSSSITFKYMHFLSNNILGIHLSKILPDIVHCRSYHATWAALKIKEKYNLNYKVIFDARGFWPLEVAYKNNWSKNSKNFKFLESIEQYNLINSDVTIAVSYKMEKYYINKNTKNTQCIYLSADTKVLNPNSKLNSNLEKKLDIDINKNEIIFCYVGALDTNTWHKPDVLLEIYAYLRQQFKKTKLIIATQSNHSKILEIFKMIPQSEIEITSFKTSKDLKNILHRSDFGILSLYKANTEQEKEQAEGVLAVKFVEYTAGGLPVIVNEQCGEASYLVNKLNLGISYNPYQIDINKEQIITFLDIKKKILIHEQAESLFSYESNASRYKKIYENLINSEI